MSTSKLPVRLEPGITCVEHIGAHFIRAQLEYAARVAELVRNLRMTSAVVFVFLGAGRDWTFTCPSEMQFPGQIVYPHNPFISFSTVWTFTCASETQVH